MSVLYNIYCDESCHLEHDKQPIMLLGCLWCKKSISKKIAKEIRGIKEESNTRGELKWTKISKSREKFYIQIVKYFFSTDDLNFRCIIVRDKDKLNHSYYNQGSHDSFYYKMYYYLIKNIMAENNRYNIYIDIKDTRSQRKIEKLREILCYSFRDFNKTMINNLQHVRSKEVELLQLADLFMGAISYINRRLTDNNAKVAVINEIKKYTNLSLEYTTPPWEEKFNLFFFKPKGMGG